jgi:hypothetical protein
MAGRSRGGAMDASLRLGADDANLLLRTGTVAIVLLMPGLLLRSVR